MTEFFENDYKDFDQISATYGPSPPKDNVAIFSETHFDFGDFYFVLFVCLYD
jgi:hypothetical protein